MQEVISLAPMGVVAIEEEVEVLVGMVIGIELPEEKSWSRCNLQETRASHITGLYCSSSFVTLRRSRSRAQTFHGKCSIPIISYLLDENNLFTKTRYLVQRPI